jgi:hypothetical protein
MSRCEDRFYYITVYNENYAQPPMPGFADGIAEGVDGDSARHLSLCPVPRRTALPRRICLAAVPF